jgi:hypothetical protein
LVGMCSPDLIYLNDCFDIVTGENIKISEIN